MSWNIDVAKVEESAVREVIRKIGPDLTIDLADELSEGVRRTRTMLRVLRETVLSNDDRKFSQSDIEALVTSALDSLPHEIDDVFDPINCYEASLRKTVKELLQKIRALEEMFLALADACQGGASIGGIRDAGNRLYFSAIHLPEGHRYTTTFCDVMESQGYLVDRVGQDEIKYPSVHADAKSLKADRAKRRRDEPFIKNLMGLLEQRRAEKQSAMTQGADA